MDSLIHVKSSAVHFVGGDRGEPRAASAAKSGGAPAKALPIEIPSVSLDELNALTNNFSQKAMIGEGSYGRVFYAKLKDGREAAVKKLDTSSSQDSDSDFSAQVIPSLRRKMKHINHQDFCPFLLDAYFFHCSLQLSMVSRLKHEHFTEMLGYCLEQNNRILVYQYATMGSLHDVLHGIQLPFPQYFCHTKRFAGLAIQDIILSHLSWVESLVICRCLRSSVITKILILRHNESPCCYRVLPCESVLLFVL